MRKIILANWKAQLSPAKAEKWLADFRQSYRADPSLQVILAPSVLDLPNLKNAFDSLENVSWSAQDVSPYPPGSYTGAIPASSLFGLAEYVLVGHRERRRYFHETVEDVAGKVREAVAANIKPILCIDREAAGRQIAALDNSDIDHVVLAYTPDDADALEIARSMEDVSEAVAYFARLTGGRPVLYGGGVQADNIADYMNLPGLAGVMTASASLDPSVFLRLLKHAGSALDQQESGRT